MRRSTLEGAINAMVRERPRERKSFLCWALSMEVLEPCYFVFPACFFKDTSRIPVFSEIFSVQAFKLTANISVNSDVPIMAQTDTYKS